MTDRRVERTWAALHQALIGLILEKGYDKITVNDIVTAANVGRSTFYTHFTGKDQLLEAGLSALHKSLLLQRRARAVSGGPSVEFEFSRALFEHAADYQPMFRAMVGKRAGTVVLEKMRALLTDLVREDLKAFAVSSRLSDIPRSALLQHVVGALMSTLAWWLEERKKWSPEDVDSLFRRLTLHGLAG